MTSPVRGRPDGADPAATVGAMQWSAEAFLRLAAVVRRFNADQIALQERWLRRYSVAARR